MCSEVGEGWQKCMLYGENIHITITCKLNMILRSHLSVNFASFISDEQAAADVTWFCIPACIARTLPAAPLCSKPDLGNAV